MNAFETFSLNPRPLLDREQLKSLYLKKAEERHPDKVADGDKEAAGKKLAELNRAFETLVSDPLRLALLEQLVTGTAPARTGRVVGADADRMMRMAEICRQVDALLLRRNRSMSAIETAMMGGEIMEATGAVHSAQFEIAEWNRNLQEALATLDEDWNRGVKDAARVHELYHLFSYAEKARQELEKRFLKLAESLE